MNDEYIKREAVIKGFTDLLQKPGDIYPTDITTMMQRVPAEDVRPVVYCRDCAVPHNEWTGCPKLNGTLMCPEDFCSYGVNKKKGKCITPPKNRDYAHMLDFYECPFCGYIEDCLVNFCPNCGVDMRKVN